MPGCAVATCGHHNRKTKGMNIVYHIFPKDPTVRKRWIDACKRSDNINLKYATVCSAHFTDEDYVRDLKSELLGLQPSKVLKSGAVPTLNLSGTAPTSGKAWRFPVAPQESMVETHFIKCEPESCNLELNQQFSAADSLTNIKVEEGETVSDDGVSKEIVKVEHEMQDVMEEAYSEEQDIAGDPLNETHSSSAISKITFKNNFKTEANGINRSENCCNHQLKIQTLLEKCEPECDQKWQYFDSPTQNEDRCAIINVDLYSCNQCSKVFHSQMRLKEHSIVHSREKSYSCDICQRSFASKMCLTQHAQVHSWERPYSCNICLKSFKRRGYLKVHILRHARLKRHLCSICGRAFTKRHALQRHLAIHNADRPHLCSKCSRRFKFKSSLDRHLLLHTAGNYSCSECSRKFIDELSFSRHLRTHSGVRPSHVKARYSLRSSKI